MRNIKSQYLGVVVSSNFEFVILVGGMIGIVAMALLVVRSMQLSRWERSLPRVAGRGDWGYLYLLFQWCPWVLGLLLSVALFVFYLFGLHPEGEKHVAITWPGSVEALVLTLVVSVLLGGVLGVILDAHRARVKVDGVGDRIELARFKRWSAWRRLRWRESMFKYSSNRSYLTHRGIVVGTLQWEQGPVQWNRNPSLQTTPYSWLGGRGHLKARRSQLAGHMVSGRDAWFWFKDIDEGGVHFQPKLLSIDVMFLETDVAWVLKCLSNQSDPEVFITMGHEIGAIGRWAPLVSNGVKKLVMPHADAEVEYRVLWLSLRRFWRSDRSRYLAREVSVGQRIAVIAGGHEELGALLVEKSGWGYPPWVGDLG